MKTMLENPLVPRHEQETIIQISRDSDVANIYTTDSRYINKLNKIYKVKNTIKNKRRIVAVEYEVPAKMISFRSKVKAVNFSEEQKKNLSKNLKNGEKDAS